MKEKEFIEFIKLSHGHHTEDYCKNKLSINKCSIYDAIKNKAKDSDIIQIALNDDDGLEESFENFKIFKKKGA